MTKNLLDKIGFNCFHDLGDPWNKQNLERALDFTVQAGAKYFRPAFALQPEEYNNANADWSTHDWGTWRVAPFKLIISKGVTPVLNLYPQQIKNHLANSNADDLVNQAVTAYAKCIDVLLNNGISPSDFIIEAWNEADGKFAMSDDSAQTNTTVIDKYLTFNMKMNEECHKRGVRFMDLDSVTYPRDPNLQTVMNQYNQKMASYSSKPDWISFHPYCERVRGDNTIPEYLMTTFNLVDWDNLSEIPLAVSEFGYPSVEWGSPFSGKYPFQYARDMMIRQIIILDYLGVDPIIIYSANTNADEATANSDDCWGAYQYFAKDGSIKMTDLAKVELEFLQSMKGYHINPQPVRMPDGQYDLGYTDYAFEYINDETGHKKLFYWNPFGAVNEKVEWNGQNYDLTFNQHVKMIEADTVQNGTSNTNAPLNLTACYTDKAKYHSSDTATVNLQFDNQSNNMRSLTIVIDGNTPTGNVVSLTTTAINIPVGKSKSQVSFKLPSQDNTSYLLQVTVLENDIPQATQTIGLDVGDSWTTTPRYAALTNFNPDDQTSKDNISMDIATLNKFNINATMYYDGYYRPQNTIPGDSYQTWIGETVSKDILKQGVQTNHSYGQSALLYNMINATTGTPNDSDTAMTDSSKFKTVTRQDGTIGVESTMGIFRTGKCNECPVPGTFDGLGEQATYNMLGSFNDRDDVDHKVQYYYNPASSDWQNYIGDIMQSSLDLIGFDGWQGDTIGDIYGVPYEDKGTNNNGFHTKDTYASFINAIKPKYFANKQLGMNAVNYGGQEKLNLSKADFNYAELWQSDQPTYQDLANCIQTTKQNSDKPLIVPSYMYHDWYKSGSSDFPSTFKDDVILLKDAVIFANGGAPMELADNGYQLPTEYYPDTRTHYKIMMSDKLGNPDTGLLRKLYDFVTAYSSLLYQSKHTTNLVYIEDSNGKHINSSNADSGKVYSITSNKNGVDILQLVNLTGCTNSNWQVNNADDERTKNITPINNIKVKYYTNNKGTLYGASYETGVRNIIPYTTGSDSGGNYITFTVETLNLWNLLYISK